MTAIHIKFPALTLKAGKRAFTRIREQGLAPADVGILPVRLAGPRLWESKGWTWRCSVTGCRASRGNAH
jgi:hypothetical protein